MVGVLGFSLDLFGILSWRNSVRAFRAARPLLENDIAVNSMVLGAIAGAVIPYLFNLK